MIYRKNGRFRNGKFYAIGGEVWINTHPRERCLDRVCAIHNPSKHSMRQWPMHLRETGLIERTCPHNVGHPDPDSVDYMSKNGPKGSRKSWGIHGCDGCCYDG